MAMIQIKRIYKDASKQDGLRVLVDRLWPRGMSKSKARVDIWLKEIAPSDSLRKWFAHDPAKWNEFCRRYREELQGNSHVVGELRELAKKHKHITLLFAAKDEQHNNAKFLSDILQRKLNLRSN